MHELGCVGGCGLGVVCVCVWGGGETPPEMAGGVGTGARPRPRLRQERRTPPSVYYAGLADRPRVRVVAACGGWGGMHGRGACKPPPQTVIPVPPSPFAAHLREGVVPQQAHAPVLRLHEAVHLRYGRRAPPPGPAAKAGRRLRNHGHSLILLVVPLLVAVAEGDKCAALEQQQRQYRHGGCQHGFARQSHGTGLQPSARRRGRRAGGGEGRGGERAHICNHCCGDLGMHTLGCICLWVGGTCNAQGRPHCLACSTPRPTIGRPTHPPTHPGGSPRQPPRTFLPCAHAATAATRQ